ncbi:Fructokinase [Granulibacter bethesdensis]|uniref:Fructokinase n=2 Tax=Granulibacter bethesdensis TaxID=364410 RepID=A0AAN0RC52_9PROT|nr:Fructokinase [Granulibacter bethesdensis]
MIPASVGIGQVARHPSMDILEPLRMTAPRFDLLGIGNAIVDVIALTDDTFLSRHDMHKGSMALIDAEQAASLYAALPRGTEVSGGSAANTCAVAASMGIKVAFLGKVADDALGEAFRRDITETGVHFPTPSLQGGAPTARCLIAVTPDGQRTMNTYLGACVTFSAEDVDTSLVADSAITYLEGYLFDPPAAQAAFRKAATAAHEAGRKVALSLSDAFCVHRHRDDFLALLPNVDILFANETEITALYERNTFEEAAELARLDVALAALTRSEAGSVILHGSDTIQIPAVSTKVLDTTGAGDAYAAGFLASFAQGQDLKNCGLQGSRAAAEIIAQIGPRPLSR